MIELLLLAQDAAAAAEAPMRLFGYTIAEWSALVVFLTALAETVRTKLAKARDGKKIAAVVEAIEEAAAAHPRAVELVKASAKRKATTYGVEVGKWGLDSGLHDVVERVSRRLGPPVREESPDPEADLETQAGPPPTALSPEPGEPESPDTPGDQP